MTTEIITAIIGGLGVLAIAGICKNRKSIWKKIKTLWRWIQRISRERQARAEYLDLAIKMFKITSAIEESLRRTMDYIDCKGNMKN